MFMSRAIKSDDICEFWGSDHVWQSFQKKYLVGKFHDRWEGGGLKSLGNKPWKKTCFKNNCKKFIKQTRMTR